MPMRSSQPNVNGYIVARDFREDDHAGVDLSNGPPNGDVVAIGVGRVVYRQDDLRTTGFGHMVRIEHRLPDGQFVYSQYAHMKEASVTVDCGATVYPTTKIGIVGRTGKVEGKTGVHLHLEIKKLNSPGCGYVPSPGDLCIGPDNMVENYYNPLQFINSRRAGYDFALGFISVDGNILKSGNANGAFNFYDGFDGGSLSPSFFYPQGVAKIEESGGVLRFRSADGSLVTKRFGLTFLEDSASLNSLLTSGGGNSEITASFRAVTPMPGQFYAIGIRNGSPLLESIAIGVGVGSDGRPAVRVNDHTGKVLASDPVQLSEQGFVLLRLNVIDNEKKVVASYSVNNLSTFKSFLQHGTIFNASSTARLFAQGGIRVAQ
jgi:hypothetical protein